MINARNFPKSGGLLLAGLAAFAYYKYSKMSPEQRKNMFGDLKEKGKKLYNDYAPQEVKDMVDKQMNSGNTSNTGQSNSYSS